MIGRIEFLMNNGSIGEIMEYDNAATLEQDVRSENYFGSPMRVVLYRQKNGEPVPHKFIYECDPPLNGFEIAD